MFLIVSMEMEIRVPLPDSLRSLEADGMITRTVYAEVPPRVEYALSELGATLAPVMKAMSDWGEAYKKHLG